MVRPSSDSSSSASSWLVRLSRPSTAGATVGFTSSALSVGGTPLDVAVGDLDGKNGPDIVTSLTDGSLAVQLNSGNGTFAAPHPYPAGCPAFQVELGDLVTTGLQNSVDGHLDAVIVCVQNSGDTQYLGRLAGDGLGGFGAPDLHPELNLGPFWIAGPQSLALAQMRGPGLPPVPVFGRSNHVPLHNPEYWNALCATYDWATADCLNAPEWPGIGPLVVAGAVAQARVFTLGGDKGILAWGADSTWHWSTRELAPVLPSTAGNFLSLTIGDLGGDGPDIISAAGSCGCGYKDVPAAGQVNVLYGNNAEGVPDQVGTKFASAPGVNSIATGDFNLDGHDDLIGNSWSYDPAATVSTGAVFVQESNGAGALGPPQMFPLSHTEAFSRAPIRVADLDGNGGPDAVAIVGGQVQVLLNTQSRAALHALNPLAGIKGVPKVVRVDKKGNLLLGTATNPPTASVDLTVVLPSAKGGKASVAAKRKGGKGKKGKGKVIGHAKIKIPAGQRRALKVHLKSSALALLKKGRTLKTKLTIAAVATDGTKKTKTQALTIKPPKAKKHRR